jgi:hypothetical protein
MITKEKPAQTCDIDRHNKVNFPVKTKKIKSTGKNKKFPEREKCTKKCAKNQKYSRTGHFVKKSFGIVKKSFGIVKKSFGIVKNATDMLH